MAARNLLFCLLVVLAVMAPWWLVVALIVGGILFYQDFFEGIIVLFYFDIAYGSGLGDWRGYFLFTLGGLIFLLIPAIMASSLVSKKTDCLLSPAPLRFKKTRSRLSLLIFK